MKLKRVLYIAIATLLLTACTREVEVVVEVPVYEERESTVKFTLYTASFATKGTQDHYSTIPLEEERRIFNYAILIFNAADELEAAVVATPYDPAVPGTAGLDTDGYTPLSFTDENGEELHITLKAGQKKLFALVNAPQPLWDNWIERMPNENKKLDDYLAYTLDVGSNGGLAYITGTEEIPAGNERGFMMTPTEGLKTIYLEPTDINANIIDIEMRVGRAMAKASVASDLAVNPRSMEQQPNGELTDIQYKIKNNPNEMYVIPSVTGEFIYTPYFYNSTVNKNLYFESPGLLAGNYVPASKKNALTQLYCMENGNNSPGKDNASLVVIRGVYQPDLLYHADGSLFTGHYTKGMDFWRIIEVVNGERGEYRDKYYAEDPVNYLGENERSVRYINGVTYYFLYLDREEAEFPYPHNYTVKRNSFYNIDITKVSNAGDEKEEPDTDLPGPVPEPSDDSQITVSITIRDWDLIQSNSEL